MALLKNKLVLIIIAVLLLGGGSAYYFLFMGKKNTVEAKKKGHDGEKHADGEAHASEEHRRGEEEAHESKKQKDEDDEDEDDEDEEEATSAGEGHGGGHGGESKGPMIDPFVVNLADAGGRRYLRTSMKLELRKATESEPFLTERMPQVRDAILLLLSGKTSDQLLTAEGKSALRTELITLLNKVLKKKKLKKPVKSLYFTEFLIQ